MSHEPQSTIPTRETLPSTAGGRGEVHRAGHDVVVSSADLGWTALRVEQVRGPSTVRHEFSLEPADEQRIVVTTSGRRFVESRSARGWHGAVYERGAIGTTAAGSPTHLRWRSLDGVVPAEIHVSIPGQVVRDLAARLADDGRHGGTLRRGSDDLLLDDPVVEHTANSLVHAVRHDLPELYAESAAQFLAARLLLRDPPRRIATEHGPVDRAIAFLQDNMQRSVSLDEVAREAGFSRHHFLRVFKQTTGRTPFTFLTELRIERARAHLQSSSLSVTEIAYLCGFSSHSAFATSFRRLTGTSPSGFRQAHRR